MTSASDSLVPSPLGSAFDTPPPGEVQQRLAEAVLPVLAHSGLALVVRLRRSTYDRGTTIYPERADPITLRPGA